MVGANLPVLVGNVTIPDGALSLSKLSTFDQSTTLFPITRTIEVGGANTNTKDDSALFNNYVSQATPADGDKFYWNVPLQSGTYTFNAMGLTLNSNGIIDWYIDDTKIVDQQDWYSAGTVYNVIKSTASVVIPTTKVLKVAGLVRNKNASSVGYGIRLQMIWLNRTGA